VVISRTDRDTILNWCHSIQKHQLYPKLVHQIRFITQRSAGMAELRQKWPFFRKIFRKNILFLPMLRVWSSVEAIKNQHPLIFDEITIFENRSKNIYFSKKYGFVNIGPKIFGKNIFEFFLIFQNMWVYGFCEVEIFNYRLILIQMSVRETKIKFTWHLLGIIFQALFGCF